MKTIYRIYIILIYIIIYTLVLPFVLLVAIAFVVAMLWDDTIELYEAELKPTLPSRVWIIDPVKKAVPKMADIIGKIFTD